MVARLYDFNEGNALMLAGSADATLVGLGDENAN